MPTTLAEVSATITLAPSTLSRAGEALAGPLPVHFHFSLPVARSYATIPPSLSPPSCAMHRPSTMIGELETAKRGIDPLKSSLRHSFLPVAASTQERVPRPPSVTTFPSATA